MGPWTAAFLLLCYASFEVGARIAMGTSERCDNAKTGVEIDWVPTMTKPFTCPHGAPRLPLRSSLLDYGKTEKEILNYFTDKPPGKGMFPYTCPPPDKLSQRAQHSFIEMKNLKNKGAEHVCLNATITYGVPWPASGNHRPAWPRYGTYQHLPPQRYLHNLEHGAIVGLYNPCAAPSEITKFRAAIICTVRAFAATRGWSGNTEEEQKHKSVLRFVLSPDIKAPTCLPFIVMAWRHRLMMPEVKKSVIQRFIKQHYARGPEKNGQDGQYDVGLINSYDSSELDQCKNH